MKKIKELLHWLGFHYWEYKETNWSGVFKVDLFQCTYCGKQKNDIQ